MCFLLDVIPTNRVMTHSYFYLRPRLVRAKHSLLLTLELSLLNSLLFQPPKLMAASWILFCDITSPASTHTEHRGGWEPSPRQGVTLFTGCLTTGVIAFYFLNIWWRVGLASAEASAEPPGKRRKNASCSLPRRFRCKAGHQQSWTKWLKPSQTSYANKENNPAWTDFFNQPIEKHANYVAKIILLLYHIWTRDAIV